MSGWRKKAAKDKAAKDKAASAAGDSAVIRGTRQRTMSLETKMPNTRHEKSS